MTKNGEESRLFSKSWSGSSKFSFLKNSLVQINSKLNEKNRMITYTNLELVCTSEFFKKIKLHEPLRREQF